MKSCMRRRPCSCCGAACTLQGSHATSARSVKPRSASSSTTCSSTAWFNAKKMVCHEPYLHSLSHQHHVLQWVESQRQLLKMPANHSCARYTSFQKMATLHPTDVRSCNPSSLLLQCNVRDAVLPTGAAHQRGCCARCMVSYLRVCLGNRLCLKAVIGAGKWLNTLQLQHVDSGRRRTVHRRTHC